MNGERRRQLLDAFADVTAPEADASFLSNVRAVARFVESLGFGSLFVDTSGPLPIIAAMVPSPELEAAFGPSLGVLVGRPIAGSEFPSVPGGGAATFDDLAGLVARGTAVEARPLRGLVMRISEPATTPVAMMLFGSDVVVEDARAIDRLAQRASFAAASRRLFETGPLLDRVASLPFSDNDNVDAEAVLGPIAESIGGGVAVVVEDGPEPQLFGGAGLSAELRAAILRLPRSSDQTAHFLPATLPQIFRTHAAFSQGLLAIELGRRSSGPARLVLGMREHAFAPPQAVFLRILGSTVANALDALQMRVARRRAVDGARGLFALGQAVAGDGDLSRISALAVETAWALGGDQPSFLLTVDSLDPSGLSLLASHPHAEAGAVPDDVRRLGRQCIRQRGVARSLSPDRPALAVPLLLGERPVGALVSLGVGHASTDSDDEQRLRAVADYVVLAMQSTESLLEQQRRVRELVLLNEVARDCTDLGLDRLMPAVTHRMCQLRGVELAGLYVLDAHRSVIAGAVSGEEGSIPALRLRRDRDDGLVARAIAAKEPRRGAAEDLELHEMRRLAAERKAPHALVVPLWGKATVVGTVAVARTMPFGDDDVRLLAAIGSEIAVAVENARLFGEVRRRAAELETVQQVGEAMMRSLEPNQIASETALRLSALLNCDGARIYTREGDTLRATHHVGVAALGSLHHAVPLGSPLVRLIQSRGAADYPTADVVEPVRSSLVASAVQRIAVAPLLSPGDASSDSALSGVFALARRSSRPFSEDELRILAAVSTQLAVALQNARLHEETRRRLEELDIVSEAGRLLGGVGTMREALDAVSERLNRVLGTKAAGVLLLDETARSIRLEGASETARRAFPDLVVPLRAGLASSRALSARQAVVTYEWGKAQRARATGLFSERAWVVTAPLLAGDLAIGTLVAVDDGPETVPPALIARLTALGAQLGLAVERARLDAALERSQQQLVRRERLAALGELSSLVAHEIRNPLGVISHSLGMLGRMVGLEGDALRVYDIMREEARRLDRIVGDMLDYTRPVEPRLNASSLGKVLFEALESATASERARGTPVDGVRVVVEIPDGLPEVRLDERLVHQAAVNLLSNAFQSLRKGGTLTLRARRVRVDDRSIARVEVQDDGPGMPPEVHRRLFEPFFTTKALGSGLGLAIVRRIAEAHRGTVSLETEVGKGTTFRLDLPLDPDERAQSREATAS